MKKLISLIIGLMGLLLMRIEGQETRPSPWFPEGAEWYYGLFGEWELFGSTGCVHMTVAKDTLLADRPCKQLKLEACDGKYETLYEYVYPCGDSLFYYNYAAQDFFLLLDLSAKKGDTVWIHKSDSVFIPNPGFDPYSRDYLEETKVIAYRICNVDTIVMAGKSFRRQKAEPIRYRINGYVVSWWNFPGVYGGDIVEGLGSMSYFWGESEPMYPESGGYHLRCFFAEGKTYMTDGKCDNVAVEEPLENTSTFWRLSPQPATEIVRAVCESTVSGTWHSGRWRLVDAAGKALQGGVFTDGNFEIGLSDHPAGLYFVEITAADGTACRLKCLKAAR
ncbi:MAG: T9SS type A sorting domain-containing protein [Bacteroidales bacterium]|nr:T9SS type A sorting domain-containing protein [Bacteroidales bacterium]